MIWLFFFFFTEMSCAIKNPEILARFFFLLGSVSQNVRIFYIWKVSYSLFVFAGQKDIHIFMITEKTICYSGPSNMISIVVWLYSICAVLSSTSLLRNLNISNVSMILWYREEITMWQRNLIFLSPHLSFRKSRIMH